MIMFRIGKNFDLSRALVEKALRLDGVKNTQYGSGARTHAGSDSNRRGRLMSYNDYEMS